MDANVALTEVEIQTHMTARESSVPSVPSVPSVSIVLPVYNGAEFLTDTICSVQNQVYDDFELIVVNDASTDNTCEIVEEFVAKDFRIQLINKSENHGVAAARNTGIRNSRGRYIAFVDCDDIWHPQKLLKQGILLGSALPSVGMVYCWTKDMDTAGYAEIFENRFKYRGEILRDLLVSFSLGGGSTPLIRREVFDSVGYFDETLLQMSEDAEFYLRVAQKFHVDYVPQAMVGYRNTPNSRSSDIVATSVASLEVRIPYSSPSIIKLLKINVGRNYFLGAFSSRRESFMARVGYLKDSIRQGYKPYLDLQLLFLIFMKIGRTIYKFILRCAQYRRKTLMKVWSSDIAMGTTEDSSFMQGVLPSVSIVIPAFNSAAYVSDCLDSVISQSYENIEVLVIDDGSDDGTSAIVGEYCERDGRVRLLSNKSNLGVCASRNRGIKEAKHEYVVPLDSDDMLAAGAIKNLILKMLASDSIVMVYGARMILDAKGEFPLTRSGVLTISKTSVRNGLTTSSLVGLGGGFMLRKSKVLEAGILYDEQMRNTGSESFADHLFYFQIGKLGELAFVNSIVVGYRTGRMESMSNNFEDLTRSYEYFYSKIIGASDDDEHKDKLAYARICFYWQNSLKCLAAGRVRDAIGSIYACPELQLAAVWDSVATVGGYMKEKVRSRVHYRKSKHAYLSFKKILCTSGFASANYPVQVSKTKY